MIKLKRAPQPAIPEFTVARRRKEFDATMTRAEYERARAIRFFTDPKHYAGNVKKTKKKFNFSLYSEKAVRDALAAAFHNKCAYCEGESVAVAPADIEHFRPKSEVDTGSGVRRPGYFWMGSEWQNLLLSCQRCNRAEHHLVGHGDGETVLLGKLIQFPLSDGRKRINKPTTPGQELAAEEPYRLLLDPCRDDPAEHLVFKIDGLVKPRRRRGRSSRIAIESIKVFGLQRKGLVDDRAKKARRIVVHLSNIEDAASRHRHASARNDQQEKAAAIESLDRNLEELRSELGASATHLAVTRTVIRQRASKMKATKEYGIDLLKLVRLSERATAGE